MVTDRGQTDSQTIYRGTSCPRLSEQRTVQSRTILLLYWNHHPTPVPFATHDTLLVELAPEGSYTVFSLARSLK